MEINITITHFNGQELSEEEKEEVKMEIACLLEMKKYLFGGEIFEVKNTNLN